MKWHIETNGACAWSPKAPMALSASALSREALNRTRNSCLKAAPAGGHNIFNTLDRNGNGSVGLVEFDRLFALYNANASIAASYLLQDEAEGLLLDREIEELEEVIALAARYL